MSGDSVSALLARLSPAQQALLARRIKGDGGAPSSHSIIPRRADQSNAPLSLAQEGLWLLNQYAPQSAAYNIFGALRLRGALDARVLEAALSEMVRRHDILRTNFGIIDEVPQQVIAPARPLELGIKDLTHLAGKQQYDETFTWTRQEGRRPFNLETDRLFRINLIRLKSDDHFLFLAVHHIICDGWSLGLMGHELLSIYDAMVNQRPVSLNALPVQYGDYAAWQRSHFRPSDLEKTLARWRERLADTPLLLDLPTDRPRPPVRTFSGKDFPLNLSASLTDDLRIFLKQNRITLFMALLATLGLLLYRCTGNATPLIGSPIANRPARELEGLIGLFVNTLVFRIDLGGDPTVAELVNRVKTEAIKVYEDRELSFERLVGTLQIPREQSHSPVFQVSFALQPKLIAPKRIGELDVTQSAGIFDAVKYDLSLSMIEARSGYIAGRLEYATDLFDRGTIVGLADHFRLLLEEIVRKPGGRLSELSVLSEGEMLGRAAARNTVGPQNAFGGFERAAIEQSLPGRFAAQVARDGAALAICDAQVAWSYQELDRQANGIALGVLEQAGPGPGCVGLLFGQGAAMVAAMLGVLKAGKTYVPLDPLHPVERLQFIMRDAEFGAIVCGAEHLGLAAATGAAVLIDAGSAHPAAAGPAIERSPQTPAYLLYTSGTSGQPKGVMQSDRNVLHFMAAYTNALHLCPQDRLSLFASYGFDASVMDIYGALLNGASLHVRDLRGAGLEGFGAWLTERGITVWHSTPTLYRLAGPACTLSALATVRLVVLGGEEAIPADLALLRQHFAADCLLVNGFGPTESTLALQYFCRAQSDAGRARLPVGYPVEATQIVLLDRSGAPTDLVGEIGIVSRHVALCYHKRARLTAERFVPSPLGNGERLYRTGDLGRWRADGALEYLGRIDHQVKLRGYRIELGEIEAGLREQPGVRDAVVVARADGAGETRLVAYVAGPELESEALRAALKARLPDYMVPSAFVRLGALPLTPNGKVDRAALPAPEWQAPSAVYVAPRTPGEEVLAAIWCEVLGRAQVGIDDNFFDLGGHSLLLVRVHVKLSGALGRQIPITVLFQCPTIRSLAEHLAGLRETDGHLRASETRAKARKQSRTTRKAARPSVQQDLR